MDEDTPTFYDTALALYQELGRVFQKHGLLWPIQDRKITLDVLDDAAQVLEFEKTDGDE